MAARIIEAATTVTLRGRHDDSRATTHGFRPLRCNDSHRCTTGAGARASALARRFPRNHYRRNVAGKRSGNVGRDLSPPRACGMERLDSDRSHLPVFPLHRRHHYPPLALGASRARGRRLSSRKTDPSPRDNHLPARLRDGDVPVLSVGHHPIAAQRHGVGQNHLPNRARPVTWCAASNSDRVYLRRTADAQNESQTADRHHRDPALWILVRDDAHSGAGRARDRRFAAAHARQESCRLSRPADSRNESHLDGERDVRPRGSVLDAARDRDGDARCHRRHVGSRARTSRCSIASVVSLPPARWRWSSG